jgi:predicted outer membrane protein
MRSLLIKAVVIFAGCSLAVLRIVQAADPFPADSDFVRQADRACNQAALDAQAALKKSRDPQIKKLAASIKQDGENASRELMQLSVEKGWPAPTLESSTKSTGYSDRGYVAAQIKRQQQAIALFTQEASTGADTDLQRWAREYLPVLKSQLVTLRAWGSS